MSDSKKVSIDQLIKTWAAKLGDPKAYRDGEPYYKISKNIHEFRAKADALLDSLIKEGHDPDVIRSIVTANKIVAETIPPLKRRKRWHKKNRDNWITSEKNQKAWWDILCGEIFGNPYDNKISDVKEQKGPEDGVPTWNPPKAGQKNWDKVKRFESSVEMDDSFIDQFKENKNGG